MRRKEREVTALNALIEILEACDVCRIALKDDQGLYIVPLNYGYCFSEGKLVLYFHSAAGGRKLSAIKEDPAVAFEMDGAHRLIEAQAACGYSFAYASISGSGIAQLVSDPQEKKEGLRLLMLHQTKKDFVFDDAMAAGVTVWKVTATAFTGKRQA